MSPPTGLWLRLRECGSPCKAGVGGAHPGVMSNQLLALVAGVGEPAVVAGDAVRLLLRLDILAPVEGLLTVVAVEPVTHVAPPPARSPATHGIHKVTNGS